MRTSVCSWLTLEFRMRVEAQSIDEYVDINYHGSVSSQKTLPYATTILIKDCCLCLHVQRAARALARRFDEALRPFGLTNGQFSLLMSLNRPVPPPMAPVADLLGMDRTTLTAALKPLQRRGLVEVMQDSADRRNRTLKLTLAGHALLIQALPTWEKNHHEIEQSIPGSDPEALRQSLRALA